MGELNIDPDTATREELVAEVKRLHGVTERWASGWLDMVAANTKVWGDQFTEAKKRLDALQSLADRAVRTEYRNGDPHSAEFAEGVNYLGEQMEVLLNVPIENLVTVVDTVGDQDVFVSDKEDLFDGDPKCQHDMVEQWSGMKCRKCGGRECI